ncbi:triacylglycerol lipase [Nocardia sp. XZ_19_385]|uniref:esterase/lipase family protein n=1 Tax=Nocardia sp. XZ_19_385 TaxID=2769488 RepID=UPI001890A4DC|nr:alpha/beta fold hydrolase [Nocardia sp. XZ_19_385]
MTRRNGLVRGRALIGAVITAAAALLIGIEAPGASADESEVLTEQGLADYINQGRRPVAVANSGSSSGSSGSRASVALGSGPEFSAAIAAFGYGLLHPNAAPAGVNDWNCRPSQAHPRPVVLMHGSWMNAFDSFAYLAPRLARAGFCVFAMNYGQSNLLEGGGFGAILPGRNGVGYMEASAQQMAGFVDQVLAATGAAKVDVVAHSQGGTVANQYLKFENGAPKVERLIAFGATYHGTSLLGIATLGRMINNLGIDILGFNEIFVGHANIQQAVGSPFLVNLNRDGDTVPGIAYTAVGSRYDEVTNPYQLTFLAAGPDATVDNITLQDGCEQDFSDHLTMMYSPRTASITLRALDPAGYPELECSFNPWLIGGGGAI